jgi:exopolysaccharide biosynthesis polyprenyl glycosylphosphotransferase
MTRLLAYRAAPELAAAWVAELLLLFVTLHVIQAHFLAGPGSPFANPAISLNHAALLASVMAITGLGVGLYRADVCRDNRRLITTSFLTALIGGAAIALLSPFLRPGSGEGGVGVLVAAPLLWLLCLSVTRGAFAGVWRRRLSGRRIVVLGTGPRASRFLDILRNHRGRSFEVLGNGTLEELTPERLGTERVWMVVDAGSVEVPAGRAALARARAAGVRVTDAASFCENQLGRIDLDALDTHAGAAGLPADPDARISPVIAALRRGADIAISLALMVLTLPIMALAAIAVRLDSPGPVLYRQERVGQHGRVFTLMKFRSMRADAEACGTPRWAQENDPRITRVGHFIRLTRIDELPQLINVLRGEMSFIGPRPERPQFVAELAAQIPHYDRRACVKPGITGWAQVCYPYGASVEDARNKLAYDLYYIKHRSLLLDLLILLMTVRVILFREGAR